MPRSAQLKGVHTNLEPLWIDIDTMYGLPLFILTEAQRKSVPVGLQEQHLLVPRGRLFFLELCTSSVKISQDALRDLFSESDTAAKFIELSADAFNCRRALHTRLAKRDRKLLSTSTEVLAGISQQNQDSVKG